MKQRLIPALILIFIVCTGCYFPISGRVIDAETLKPIEGAVVLVEWTKTHGLGLTYTESYKVFETISDKDGNVSLVGCYSPFVNPPSITVYKKGYVAWNNEFIFPDYKRRNDFKWGSYVFSLVQFVDAHSYESHVSFIRSAIHSSINLESKKLIYRAINWETDMATVEKARQGR